MFSSTAGPGGGAGGQSMLTFTVHAYVFDDIGPTVYICCDCYCFDDSKFEPFKKITNWKKIPKE